MLELVHDCADSEMTGTKLSTVGRREVDIDAPLQYGTAKMPFNFVGNNTKNYE